MEDITLMSIEIEAEYQSDAGTTKDTPYLALTGELWGVLSEYLWENQPRYNGTSLYYYSAVCKLQYHIIVVWVIMAPGCTLL